jgi:hypothetical protein
VPWSASFNIIGFIQDTAAQQSIPAMYGSSFEL